MIHQVTTRAGKAITIISQVDLIDPQERGDTIRAYCHFHGGDHQRSLSIKKATGWGHCFNAACEVTVLVEELNPEVSRRLLERNMCLPHQSNASRAPNPHHATPSAPPQESWQQTERAVLLSIDELMREALLDVHIGDAWQAQAYLATRGIPLEVAEAAGVVYLPAIFLEQADLSPHQRLLGRWSERLLFPLTSPSGKGYVGRSLWRWQIGMDEHAHKAILEQEYAPRRWIKTNPAGWFCAPCPPVDLAAVIILVEGPFDRLALLAGGFAPDEVVALVGVAAQAEWFPDHIRGILLALDQDAGGRDATRRLMNQLMQMGRLVECCAPPEDGGGKDWSERWRKADVDGLEPLYPAFALLEDEVMRRSAEPSYDDAHEADEAIFD